MSDVPSDLFRDILLRLPADSLLRFRAVCKDWRRTIDSSSFIKSHTLYQHHSHTPTLLLRDSVFCRLYSLSLHPPLTYAHLTRIKTLVRTGVPLLRHLPTTSCNGLLLISHYNFTKKWVVWNPLTREFHTLPEPDFHIDIPFAGVGIGYDLSSDDYKVVKIYYWYRDGKIVYTTLIYSLKTGSWKPIKDFPCDSILLRSEGVYLDGALHWLSENVIMALDLGIEEYRLVLPPLTTRLGEPLDMYVDAMDGCLILSCYYTSEGLLMDGYECLEGWVMEGAEWVKLFSFGEEAKAVSVAAVMREVRPVAYLKSRGQVFLHHDRHFYCLDVCKNSGKKVSIQGLPQCFTCQDFRGSLVRLVDHHHGVAGKRSKAGVNWKKKKRDQTRFFFFFF
ncbi:F-box protein CPR1-like [Salvia miltiorrhiza]|uniref:F-box protein CPR1-like n=1 Tax=Salvia miltiorrhiza TaxID=226208 RepID=UPI0025AC1279|nr:F-box protein CPR1-like [Salvia miltiorrhiza]